MKFNVLYGTESGNSEFIAQDLVDFLVDQGHEAVLGDLLDTAPTDISPEYDLTFVICSTHGEGELPHTALPFYTALDAEAPDLGGVHYAMFGLGDMFYAETYSQGSEIIDRKFSELGATRVGEYGRHDASSLDLGTDLALEWAPRVIAELAAVAV